MWPFLTQVKLEDFTQDYLELTQKNLKGLDNLKRVKEEDIQCGVSEKEAVYREDKIILYHFKPVVEKPFEIPLLMVYALVNRPYMVDLQEGRSLVANLLKLGLDIYLIDWGYPTRSDRWLTLDDYINGYVDNCVDFIRQSQPLQLGYQKYLDFPDIMEDESKLVNFLRMEKWIFDSPDQAGESYRQFLKDFYQQNKLIKGEVMLGDKRVDLHNLTMPILNLYADKDHLVPPASSLALGNYIGTSDYTACAFPVGHIGMYVSGKVQRDLPPAISDWLKARA